MPRPTEDRLDLWKEEQARRQLKRFVTCRGPRPARKPKEKK